MAHCTTPKTLESTLLPELEESIANIQARGISQKDFDQDLNKNQKIWLVIGICLHNIISPILRENVEDVMTTMYSALVKSDHINTQTYPGHLKFYPPNGVYAYYLNYENINNNKVLGRQTQLFNYKVKDAVDLSKLFLLTNMTSYTGFDETCDLSALLGIVINVDSFHQIGKTAAANIRADIRNPWAHCDFTQWNKTKCSQSFNLMETLIKNVGLSSFNEKQSLDRLITWKTNGNSFLSGTTLGLELVKEIHEETCVLAKHAQVLANHFKVIDIQISNVNNTLKELKELQQVLTDMKTNFEDRISFLEKNVIEIKSEMKQQKESIESIERHMEKMSDISHGFSSAIQAELGGTMDTKQTLTTEPMECIPRNIRAQHNQYLEEWRKDDVTFVYTRAARHAISSIKTNNCLVVTGSSGTGKSFIVHHIALHLFKKDGYEIIPFVTGPSDIIQYYDPDRKQVFVVDDICGKESINSHIVGLWKFYSLQLEKIFPHLGNFKAQNICQGTKLVISCRLQIFKDKLFRNIQLFTRNACNLSLSDMCLLPQERSLMIQQYLPKEMINYVENILGNFDFFPLLCCLSRGKTSEELVKLFSSPIDIITNDVNSIYLNNKFQFCALVLCVLFQKGFNVTWIKSKSMPAEIKFHIYEIVKELSIDLNIDSFRKSLVEGFTTLEDTYLKKRGTSYRIIHDKVHTFISVICSEHLTSCFLRYAPSSFVRDHFRFKCCQTEYTDNSVALETEMEEEYFDRLLDDLKNGEMQSIFYNRLLLFTSFRNKLLDYFKRNEEAMFFFKYNNSKTFNVAKSVEYNYYSNFTHTWIEAAFAGFIDVFKFLIDIEWNQIQSHIRISTLYAACRNGNVDIVSLLLNGNTNIAHNTVTTVHLAAAHTLLLVACIEGHQAVVHILLNSITDLSQFIRKDIKSSLHNACEDINTDLENLFNISTGLDFRRLCVHGRSPLYMACYKGHFDITRMLLNKGADTSILCDSSLFAKACKEGYTDILKILIANERSINNLNGNTLLVEASKRGHTETVQVLLDSNTEIFQFYDFSIRLPLFIACQKGHTDIVRLLLKYSLRFSCFQCNSYGRVPPDISEEVEYKDIENMTSEYNTHAKLYGYTYLFIGGYGKEENKLSFKIKSGYFNKYTKLLLQMACYIGHIGTVKVLLENGFDVNQCNSYGISCLYAACVKGHTNIVNLLLDENADVFKCDKFGKSPLFVACENGHADTVKLLLEHNAEISPCGRSKKSPFFVACEKGYADIVRILLESNVDVFECDRYGRSSLYVACKNGHSEIVNILLSNDVATFKHDKYGKSPMCVACEGGHLHIVNLLLKNSFDFSHCVYRECSVILTALGKGHIEIANMLLQNNTDRCQCDGFERTPYGIVCEIENGEITNILTKLYNEYSTQFVGDTNTVEILFYSRFFSDYKILHLHIPRLRLYTEIFNHFLKSEQQNENKTNNQECLFFQT